MNKICLMLLLALMLPFKESHGMLRSSASPSKEVVAETSQRPVRIPLASAAFPPAPLPLRADPTEALPASQLPRTQEPFLSSPPLALGEANNAPKRIAKRAGSPPAGLSKRLSGAPRSYAPVARFVPSSSKREDPPLEAVSSNTFTHPQVPGGSNPMERGFSARVPVAGSQRAVAPALDTTYTLGCAEKSCFGTHLTELAYFRGLQVCIRRLLSVEESFYLFAALSRHSQLKSLVLDNALPNMSVGALITYLTGPGSSLQHIEVRGTNLPRIWMDALESALLIKGRLHIEWHNSSLSTSLLEAWKTRFATMGGQFIYS